MTTHFHSIAGLARVSVLGGCALLFGTPAQAVTIIPDKSGFSGYVNVGAGGIEFESNLLAGLASGIVDVGDAYTDDIDSSPDSDSAVIPMLNFELSYTFAETRTQLYLGNLLEDFLTFDLSALAGVRQDIGGAGILGAALVNTSLSADVWEDPYQLNEKRKDTESSSLGYRISWDRIFNTGLTLQYTSKSVEIDTERSGEALGFSKQQRDLLDRNGDLHNLQVSYEFHLASSRHILTPRLHYRDADLDGGAMANDGYGYSLNYIYTHNQRWRWVFNGLYQNFDYGRINPVYGSRDSAERYGISTTAFYTAPFGWKPWTLNVTAAYFEEEHKLDFYDSSVAAVTVALLRRF
ncbi:DUF2860 family protein [Mangrovimicrobium sediminis]|nr:DUF2860 family protein [Haliea sp. SAOS-164]